MVECNYIHWSFIVKTDALWNRFLPEDLKKIRNDHKDEQFDLWHNCLKLKEIVIGIVAASNENILWICSQASPSDISFKTLISNFRQKSLHNLFKRSLACKQLR